MLKMIIRLSDGNILTTDVGIVVFYKNQNKPFVFISDGFNEIYLDLNDITTYAVIKDKDKIKNILENLRRRFN